MRGGWQIGADLERKTEAEVCREEAGVKEAKAVNEELMRSQKEIRPSRHIFGENQKNAEKASHESFRSGKEMMMPEK